MVSYTYALSTQGTKEDHEECEVGLGYVINPTIAWAIEGASVSKKGRLKGVGSQQVNSV